MNTRTRFTTDGQGRVTVTYFNIYEQATKSREFTVANDGGYVYEITDGMHKQVCGQLAYRGATLTATDRAALPSVIRREYQAMRREEKRLGVFGM